MDIMRPNFCRSCGQSTIHSDIFCWQCGYQLKSKAAPKVKPTLPLPQKQVATDPELRGIRGWLAWFGAGVALTPFLASYGLYMDFASYAVVAGQGFGAIVMAEIIANLTQIILSLWGLLLLAQRRMLAVNVFIGLMLVAAAISLIDLGFLMYLESRYGLSSGNTQLVATARSFMTAAIWIPYLLRSRRVKATLTA